MSQKEGKKEGKKEIQASLDVYNGH